MTVATQQLTHVTAMCSHGTVRHGVSYRILSMGPDYVQVSVGGQSCHAPKWVFGLEASHCDERDAKLLRRVNRFAFAGDLADRRPARSPLG